MAEERMSDPGVIAMHYNENISVDDVCLAKSSFHYFPTRWVWLWVQFSYIELPLFKIPGSSPAYK